MKPDLAAPGVDHSESGHPSTPQAQVVVLLRDALQKLADTGEVDAACRIAGKACVILRDAAPRAERRFNVLLHRLVHRLGSAERRKGDE